MPADVMSATPLDQPSRLSEPEVVPSEVSEISASDEQDAVYFLGSEEQAVCYTMKLATPPPKKLALGQAIVTPLIVTFQTSDNTSFPANDKAFDFEAGLSGVWTCVSLLKDDRITSLAPPRPSLLLGQTVDSIHLLHHAGQDTNEPFGYTKFSNLSITEPGRYCFQVTVIDMNRPIRQEANSMGARVMPTLCSDTVEVVEDDCEVEKQEDDMNEAITHLRSLGVEI